MEEEGDYEKFMYQKYTNFKVFLQNHLKEGCDLTKILPKMESFYKMMDFAQNDKPHAQFMSEKLFFSLTNLNAVAEHSQAEQANEKKLSMKTTLNYKRVIEQRKKRDGVNTSNNIGGHIVENGNDSVRTYKQIRSISNAQVVNQEDPVKRFRPNESFGNSNFKIANSNSHEEKKSTAGSLYSFLATKNKPNNNSNPLREPIEEEDSRGSMYGGPKDLKPMPREDPPVSDNAGGFVTGKQMLDQNMSRKKNTFENNNNYNRHEEPANNINNTGGFMTGKQLFDESMSKKKKGGFDNGYDDDRSNNRFGKNSNTNNYRNNNNNYRQQQSYGNDYDGGPSNLINSVNRSVFGSNLSVPQRQPQQQQQQPSYSNYNNTQADDDKNGNKNAGLRKKFVPPFKDSAQKQTVGNNRLQRDGSGNDGDKVLDEKYKGLDPKMVEMIELEIVDRSPSITYDDIAGLKFAKKTIFEIIVWPMLRPDIFNGLRAPPKGLLLFGPPGTGKTMIGKAIATESKATFFSISASSLTSKWVGEGEKMVKTLFAIAQIHAPSVIFIDEIDSLLCARSENDVESSRRIKTEFMIQLEGARSTSEERLLIIGATNRPQELDEAVRRRFTKRLYIPLPNSDARRELINTVIKGEVEKGNRYELSEAEITEIVELSKGYSGADMRNLCAEASMVPIRSIFDIKSITAATLRATNISDFKEALKTVKATVSARDLGAYMDWNNSYGSFDFSTQDLEN